MKIGLDLLVFRRISFLFCSASTPPQLLLRVRRMEREKEDLSSSSALRHISLSLVCVGEEGGGYNNGPPALEPAIPFTID